MINLAKNESSTFYFNHILIKNKAKSEQSAQVSEITDQTINDETSKNSNTHTITISDKQSTEVQENNNVEMMSIDKPETKKTPLKPILVDRKKEHKKKASADKVTFELPEGETGGDNTNTDQTQHPDTPTTLFNPARVLPHLSSSIRMDDNCGYVAFKPINSGGIVVVKKVGPGDETLVLEPLQVKIVSSKPKSVSELSSSKPSVPNSAPNTSSAPEPANLPDNI